jgi:hypothetical protein
LLRFELAILTPKKPARPVARRLGGYAAFDSSPPAIMFVAGLGKMIVAPHHALSELG